MKRLVALALPLVLMACGKSEPGPVPTPTPTVAQPRTLIGADLDLATLGARIEGPQGTEIATVLSAGNREIGSMVSYVACPQGVTECRPAAMPEGTVYTYVHEVTLAPAELLGANPQPTAGPEALTEKPPTLFRTTGKATGFNQAIGFSTAQAEAVLGDPDAVSINWDNGSLIWRVVAGTGWKPGGTMTFWWQSTVAPDGPADAYLLEIDGEQAVARGPFPPADKAVEGAPGS